ncbi:MAG: hypothetical protein CMJ64_18560 [Planctomycetaceae bacterium]|jgi:hypothetical protein|nr:hypothetical protein [Planctomycetaceae bacterium]
MSKQYHVIDLVDDYLHDVLIAHDAEYVAAHCESCSVCAIALAEARQRVDAFAKLPPAEPSDRLIKRTLTKIVSVAVHRRRTS